MINACVDCNDCVNLRVNVSKFKIRTSDNRKLKRLLNISETTIEKSKYTPELYAFFKEYMNARHSNTYSELNGVTQEEFKSAIAEKSDYIIFLRDQTSKEIISVAFTTQHQDELSIEMVAHTPKWKNYSPGISMINHVINIAQSNDFKHVYLGSWAKDSPKLAYKSQLNGLETIVGGQWIAFDTNIHTQGDDYTAIMQHLNL